MVSLFLMWLLLTGTVVGVVVEVPLVTNVVSLVIVDNMLYKKTLRVESFL